MIFRWGEKKSNNKTDMATSWVSQIDSRTLILPTTCALALIELKRDIENTVKDLDNEVKKVVLKRNCGKVKEMRINVRQLTT